MTKQIDNSKEEYKTSSFYSKVMNDVVRKYIKCFKVTGKVDTNKTSINVTVDDLVLEDTNDNVGIKFLLALHLAMKPVMIRFGELVSNIDYRNKLNLEEEERVEMPELEISLLFRNCRINNNLEKFYLVFSTYNYLYYGISSLVGKTSLKESQIKVTLDHSSLTGLLFNKLTSLKLSNHSSMITSIFKEDSSMLKEILVEDSELNLVASMYLTDKEVIPSETSSCGSNEVASFDRGDGCSSHLESGYSYIHSDTTIQEHPYKLHPSYCLKVTGKSQVIIVDNSLKVVGYFTEGEYVDASVASREEELKLPKYYSSTNKNQWRHLWTYIGNNVATNLMRTAESKALRNFESELNIYISEEKYNIYNKILNLLKDVKLCNATQEEIMESLKNTINKTLYNYKDDDFDLYSPDDF